MGIDVKIEHSWKHILKEEFSKDYFLELVRFIKNEKKRYTVFPPGQYIFRGFEICPFDKVKVVILGQDPYHGKGQANGLAFSVFEGVKTPPSLENIFKEIKNDLGSPLPSSGNLDRWASQGVFLLNTVLTVIENKPNAHSGKGWEIFTDKVIETISLKKENIVFILWGAYAKKKTQLIDTEKHLILSSPHPSPLSANRGFFGSKHFSKTNAYLQKKGKNEIQW